MQLSVPTHTRPPYAYGAAALLLLVFSTGCGTVYDGEDLTSSETQVDEDTVYAELTMGDDEISVTFALVDEEGSVIVATLAAEGTPVPIAVVEAKTPYEVFLAMGGEAEEVPDFIAQSSGGASGAAWVHQTPYQAGCSLAEDGGLFDLRWQDWGANWGTGAYHWYYSGSTTYKSTPTYASVYTFSHLCNGGVNGSGQVRHRQRGTKGAAWYQYTQTVPKGYRSQMIGYFPPNYTVYNSYATRLSYWYTASGNYKLGIIAKKP